jgi:PAS domain S-box-containing protein
MLVGAAIVADEANRIIHVTAEAGRLLGWAPDDLVGRRLLTIVPPAMREAHLAGFGRYLMTRQPHLLGRRVVLPVLRGDGSQVDVAVVIDEMDVGTGVLAFVAQMTPA